MHAGSLESTKLRRVKVARNEAENNSSFLSALQKSYFHHSFMMYMQLKQLFYRVANENKPL